MTLAGVSPNNVALLMLGRSVTGWAATPLPLELGILGAPGCWLGISPDVILSTVTNGTGAASISLPVPGSPRTLGQNLFAQWIGVDVNVPATNPAFPLAFSEWHRIIFQR